MVNGCSCGILHQSGSIYQTVSFSAQKKAKILKKNSLLRNIFCWCAILLRKKFHMHAFRLSLIFCRLHGNLSLNYLSATERENLLKYEEKQRQFERQKNAVSAMSVDEPLIEKEQNRSVSKTAFSSIGTSIGDSCVQIMFRRRFYDDSDRGIYVQSYTFHVVAFLDKTLYDNYLCLVASNKQRIYAERSQSESLEYSQLLSG